MYLEFYNLAHPPFENTPDPRFFYGSEPHQEALAALEYTVRLRKGFALITGEPGLGKTMIARMACGSCREQADLLCLAPGHRRPQTLLAQLLNHLGQTETDTRLDLPQLFHLIEIQLDTADTAHKPMVLLADEAQTYSDDALDTLRLLSWFDGPQGRPFQVVLIGQPVLRRRLAGSTHASLRQQIVLAKELRPLTAEETREYIAARLQAAANPEQPASVEFTAGATREIHRLAEGVPRTINALCDNGLLLGFTRQEHSINATIVHQVGQDMMPNVAPGLDETAPALGSRKPGLALAGGM